MEESSRRGSEHAAALPRARWIALATLAALCIQTPAAAQGRPIRFENLGPDDGLSQSDVLFVFQDSHGFIWLGTENGLNRYDGYRLTLFTHDPGDPGSLPDDFVWAMSEDAGGDLWVATEAGGVGRWRRSDGRFERYRHEPGDASGLASNRTRALWIDRQGAIWVGTRDQGLDRLDPETGEVTHHRHDPADPHSLSHDGIFSVFEDASGELWVGTDGGLNRFDRATGRFARYPLAPPRPGEPAEERVRGITEDGEQRLWVGTRGGGLNRLSPARDHVTRFRHDPDDPSSLSDDWVRAVMQDDAGRIWVGTNGALDLLRADERGFDHYRAEPARTHSLPDSSIMSLLQDRGGVIWVGTQFGGVSRWHPSTWTFGHHGARSSRLSGGSISAFAEDRRGRLWIGTYGQGLNRLDPETNEVEHFRRDPDDPHSLSDDWVSTLHTDSDGTLWVGTRVGGLNRYDEGSGRFDAIRHEAAGGGLAADGVMSILEDEAGVLWIGTFGGGLNRFDRSTGRITTYRHSEQDPESLSGDIVTSIVRDRSGVVWLGTEGGGLNRLDPDTGRVRRFEHRVDDAASLSSDTIYSLYLDPEGTLWIGTRGGGLDRLVHGGGGEASLRNYSKRDGLVNDVVWGIVPDDSGHLWLSTNGGLARFDPRSGSFDSFTASNGLQGNEFNFGAHYRSSTGQLFFGGVNGFNAFFPERLERNTHAPPVVLTAFLKLNRPVPLDRPVHLLETVSLEHGDDVVTFEFAALDFAAPEENRYRYRLDGFDSDWVDAGEVHRVTYTNLSPGSYTFRVAAANNDGVWNEQGFALPLTVLPPPWRTWWAYSLYVMALGALVYAVAENQRRKAMRQAEYRRQLEREVAARTHELRERNLELEDLNRRLSEASLTDSLTGLRNRRFLFEQVARDAALIQREYQSGRQPSQLAFIMIDLDDFKPINDTHGHAAGDGVLLQVRDILGRACRNSDVLIRWGGDEFLVVGREVDLGATDILPERIRSAVERHEFDLGEGLSRRLTCSIGVACYPFLPSEPAGINLEQVVVLADKALYAAKRSGRNAWVCVLANERTDTSTLEQLSTAELAELVDEDRVALRSSLPREREPTLS
jgi:diguanylate cyclase (GGDEF)-like protein